MEDRFDDRRQIALEHLRSHNKLKLIEWFSEVDSTNLHARRWILKSASANPGSPLAPFLPALFITDRQTAGRGRNDRSWWSPAGCLMLSMVVDQATLPVAPENWTQLGLVAGVALARSVDQLLGAPPSGPMAQLKWPNDVYLSNRKLAGILVEAIPIPRSPNSTASVDGPAVAFVIGIGLNVNVQWESAPPELRDRGCSLNQVTGRIWHMEDVLVQVVEHLSEDLMAWRSGDGTWWHDWNERNLLNGRLVSLRMPGGHQVTGQCEGIDATGQLLIRDSQRRYSIQSADVLDWS